MPPGWCSRVSKIEIGNLVERFAPPGFPYVSINIINHIEHEAIMIASVFESFWCDFSTFFLDLFFFGVIFFRDCIYHGKSWPFKIHHLGEYMFQSISKHRTSKSKIFNLFRFWRNSVAVDGHPKWCGIVGCPKRLHRSDNMLKRKKTVLWKLNHYTPEN